MAAIGVVLALLAGGCRAPLSGTRTPEPTSVPTAQSGVSIEDAVLELADRAQAGDTGYFQDRMPGYDGQRVANMIEVVAASDMLNEYRSRITTTTESANLDFHSQGSFQVDLVLRDGDWVVDQLGF